jgi:hypothetical protein
VVISATYKEGRVTGGEGEDVGAGDGAGAGVLQGDLDLVDHLESPGGVPVGVGPFLADDAGAVVQQYRGVASLHTEKDSE